MTSAHSHDDPPEIPELPVFLRRDAANQSEISMKTPQIANAPEAEAPAAETPATPRKPKGKAKPNGTVKAAKGTAGKLAKAAKAAATLPKAKRAKPGPRNVDTTKLDKFGFRLGSLKSKAAEMYARKQGATVPEVREALESTQFNLLTQLRTAGWVIDEKQEDSAGPRAITRYYIRAKK